MKTFLEDFIWYWELFTIKVALFSDMLMPLIIGVVIVIVINTYQAPGRGWLIAFLVFHLIGAGLWGVHSFNYHFDLKWKWYYLSFFDLQFFKSISMLIGYLIIIPFILSTTNRKQQQTSSNSDVKMQAACPPPCRDKANPLYGVSGWLKLFVVVHMYINPIISGLLLLVLWPSVLINGEIKFIFFGLIITAVEIFLVVKWVLIARNLKNIVSGVLRETKTWLIITLCVKVVSSPLLIMIYDGDEAVFEIIKELLKSIISFSIWYGYFSVSKRVKTTYVES